MGQTTHPHNYEGKKSVTVGGFKLKKTSRHRRAKPRGKRERGYGHIV